VTLTTRQREALISFCFNVGPDPAPCFLPEPEQQRHQPSAARVFLLRLRQGRFFHQTRCAGWARPTGRSIPGVGAAA